MNKSERLLGLLLSWWATWTPAVAASYSVTDLGPYSNVTGQDEAGPKAINRQGVVLAVNAVSGAYRAFLYDGAWTDLGTLGGNLSVASGLNDSSLAVGYSRNASGASRGFLWTPGGTDGVPTNPQMKEIGTFGGRESAAFAINEAGQVTGYAQTSNRDHAFRYRNGELTDIGALLPGGLAHSYGFGINEAGHIVGTGYNAGFSTWQAFYYDGTRAVALSDPRAKYSSGLALNDADHLVGYWTTDDDLDRPFHYHDGVMTDLGTLGGNYAYALAINNHNAIVGGSFVDRDDRVYHAFISSGGALMDLNDLADASLAGWTLVEARAINDLGQIVGVGRVGGADRIFLLNPAPEITGIEARGKDAQIRFTTVKGATYTLVGRDTVAGGASSDIVTGIAGQGTIVTVTDVGALTQPRRFYRARLDPP